MSKVVLEYSGRKFPLTLDVDQGDAERLVETSGQDFRILAHLEDPKPKKVPASSGHLCPVCLKGYKHAASLKRHMKAKHADYNGK